MFIRLYASRQRGSVITEFTTSVSEAYGSRKKAPGCGMAELVSL